MDILVAVLFAGLATLIAMGTIRVPSEFTGSIVVQAILLLVALSFFAYSPVVGVAAIALFAVLIFHRNVQMTAYYSNTYESMGPRNGYGDETIYREYVKTQPYVTASSEPTAYPTYTPTPKAVWGVEGFEAAPFNAGEASVEGQYPLPGPSLAGGRVEQYDYRPDPETGSNLFQRYGPDMDEKKDPLRQY
jgi:hypothetical protein